MLSEIETIRFAHSFSAGHPLPVCVGCPSGQFEDACAEWMATFVRTMRGFTGYSWMWSQPFPGKFAVEIGVTREDTTYVIAEVGPGKHGGKAMLLVPVPPADAPDRIGEILAAVKNLQQMTVARDANLGGLIQRAIILTNYYGRAAYRMKFLGFTLTIERDPDTLPQPLMQPTPSIRPVPMGMNKQEAEP